MDWKQVAARLGFGFQISAEPLRGSKRVYVARNFEQAYDRAQRLIATPGGDVPAVRVWDVSDPSVLPKCRYLMGWSPSGFVAEADYEKHLVNGKPGFLVYVSNDAKGRYLAFDIAPTETEAVEKCKALLEGVPFATAGYVESPTLGAARFVGQVTRNASGKLEYASAADVRAQTRAAQLKILKILED